MVRSQTKRYNPLPLLTRLGRIVFTGTFAIFILGFVLILYHNNLQNQCDFQQEFYEASPERICNFTHVISGFGITFLQASIVIWFIEITLKRASDRETQENMETLTNSIAKETKKNINILTQSISQKVDKDARENTQFIVEKMQSSMQTVVNSIEITRDIQVFYQTKDKYKKLILDNFKNSNHSEIKILGLFEEIKILEEFKRSVLKQKIIDGCHIKILVPDPESLLIQCLNKSSYLYSRESITHYLHILYKLREDICSYKKNNQNSGIKGSLELKFHKDFFSPCCYYSNHNLKIISMCLNDSEGHDFPAFQLANQEFIEDIEKHFQYLWIKGITILEISENSE